jgi:hypothetical protein
MGVTDNYVAYQFDRAVEIYGHRVDELLKETDEVSAARPKPKKGYFIQKPKYTLEKALRQASKPVQAKPTRANSDFLILQATGKTSMVE